MSSPPIDSWQAIGLAARLIADFADRSLRAGTLAGTDPDGPDPWTPEYGIATGRAADASVAAPRWRQLGEGYLCIVKLMDEASTPPAAASDWERLESFLRNQAAGLDAHTPLSSEEAVALADASLDTVIRYDVMFSMSNRRGFEQLYRSCMTVAGIAGTTTANEEIENLRDRVTELEQILQAISVVSRPRSDA